MYVIKMRVDTMEPFCYSTCLLCARAPLEPAARRDWPHLVNLASRERVCCWINGGLLSWSRL